MQHAAIWHWYWLLCIYVILKKKILLLSIPFLYILKSGIDKSTEWSMIPACPSLMFFFNRGHTERTNSLKILCLVFCVCFVICKVVSELILWFLRNLWFDDLSEE